MSDILPANASQLQRDLDASIGPRQALLDATNTIPGIKYTPPDQLLPWLVWEYGLEQLLPYLNDPRLAIQEGVQWQRIKGTPASLNMALGWLELNDVEIEPETPGVHFHQFQLDSGQIIAGELLEKLRIVSQFSAPLRSRLARIYHKYDVRRLKLDESDYGALLSDYSGVDKNGVVLSFGRQQTSEITLTNITAERSQNSYKVAYTRDIHWPDLDNQVLGGVVQSSTRSNYYSQEIEVAVQNTNWLGYWDDRRWLDGEFPTITLKALRLYVRDHTNDTKLSAPSIQLSANLSFANDIEFKDESAKLGLTSNRNLTLDSKQQSNTQQANSWRNDHRESLTLPHGLSWLGHWDSRQWQHDKGVTIGRADRQLGTHYYNASTFWQIDPKTGLTQGRSFDTNIQEQIKHDYVKHYPLALKQAITSVQSDSSRSDNRSKGVYCFEQQWLGHWDQRQWLKTTSIIVGAANNPLVTNYYQLSMTWQINGETSLIQGRAHSSRSNEQIQDQHIKHYPLTTGITLVEQQDDALRTSGRSKTLYGLTRQWFGFWDELQWQDNHHAVVRLDRQGLTERQHQKDTQLNEPVFGGSYLAHSSLQSNLGQVYSPSMRVRITPNRDKNPTLDIPQQTQQARLSIKHLQLEAKGDVWFGYWDHRMWHHDHTFTVGQINHTQK